MAHRNQFGMASLLGGTLRMFTLSIFLGFGLTACSDNAQDAGEPVAADGAMSADEGAANSAEAAPADNAGAESSPGELAPETAAEAPPSEESVVAMDDGAPTPPSAAADDPGLSEPLADHPAEAAPPPELSENASDTVKAELTDHPPEVAPPPAEAAPAPMRAAPAAPVAVAAAESDGLSDTFDSKTPAATSPDNAVNSSNSVSSPGAARFISGRHEGRRHSGKVAAHGKHHHKHAAKGGKEVSGDTGEYVVVAGDTLGRISRKIYGTPKSWTSLAELNSLESPYIIHPREALKYDAGSEQGKAFKAKYQASVKTIEVKPGDSLSKIAAQVYGDSSAWPTLASLNQDVISDPNRLEVGMKLSYLEGDGAKNTTAAVAPAAATPAPAATPASPDAKPAKATAKVHKKHPATQPSH